jgi:acetyl esterase
MEMVRIKNKKSFQPHWKIYALYGIGLLLVAYAWQSIALWLPFPFFYPYAANATVWPLLQLGVALCVGLIGVAFFLLHQRKSGIIFSIIAFFCIVPSAQVFVSLNQFASQHQVSVPLSSQFSLMRSYPAADEPRILYGLAGHTNLYLSSYTAMTPSRTHPAIVYVHGGGWSGGSRTENSQFLRTLTTRGYDVFSIDYRFAHTGYASWNDAPRDVVCSLVWLEQHAAEYHVDPTRVTVMGDSAGGQLALRAAYGIKNGDVTSSCGGTPIIPSSVVGIVPAVDAHELYGESKLSHASHRNIVRYLGGTPSSEPERYNDATISTHVTPGLMPTLIINAAKDTMVSADSGEKLAAKLRAAQVTVEQYTIPYAVHSYWIYPGGYQNQTAQVLIERFLARY